MIWLLATILWSAAEASFFFIVPDVLLTVAVLRLGLKRALLLCVMAAAMAAITGAMMWLWAGHDEAGAWAAMLAVPAVGPDLILRVQREFDGAWFFQMARGAVSGVPYKLYAVEAGVRHIPLWLFIPASFAARLTRFLLTVLLTAAGQALLLRWQRPAWAMPLWAAAWVIVYLLYFSLRGF
jgi:membrane protein YqaA with SNARE-associated domain